MRYRADMKHVPKLRSNRRILRTLERALEYAEMTNCSVDDVHKDVMRVYLKTWVSGPLEAAIRDMMGGAKSTW